MTRFSLDALMEIMRECAGEDEAAQARGDIGELDFEELGYDSLALMETASRVSRQFGIVLPEEELAEVRTPPAFVALVNRHLERAASAEVSG